MIVKRQTEQKVKGVQRMVKVFFRVVRGVVNAVTSSSNQEEFNQRKSGRECKKVGAHGLDTTGRKG